MIGFSHSFEMYSALAVCMGVGSLGNYSAAIVLGKFVLASGVWEITSLVCAGSETIGKKFRNLICTFVSIGYALGYMFVPVIAYLLQQWRWYAWATGLVGILYIPFIW